MRLRVQKIPTRIVIAMIVVVMAAAVAATAVAETPVHKRVKHVLRRKTDCNPCRATHRLRTNLPQKVCQPRRCRKTIVPLPLRHAPDVPVTVMAANAAPVLRVWNKMG